MTNGRDAASRGGESKRSTSQSSSFDPRRPSADQAGDALSKVADTAQQAGSQAKQAAASLASEAGESAKHLANQQMRGGADLAHHVARAVRLAADNLNPNAPLLAKMAHVAADNVEELSRSIRGQSVEEAFEAASDFARRRPAVVFGAAAACGFVLFRLLNAGTAESGRFSRTHRHSGAGDWPLQPTGDEWSRHQGEAASGVGEAAGGVTPGNRATPASTPAARLQRGQFHGS